ncbi:MAG: phospho-sugar mutase [Spirochaetota bacterium]
MRSYAEALAVAESWTRAPFDNDTITSVRAILSLPDAEREKAILDQFGYDLSFGTAGMRALMDVGTARMNEYTIARVSAAVAQVLKSQVKGKIPQVVIGYDARRNSEKFAKIAAQVYLAAGIQVHRFNRIVPTPVVPFFVRRLNADCGVVITSSHNTAPYNGYKVYAANGAQILSPFDTDVMAAMAQLPYALPGKAVEGGKLVDLSDEILREYVSWVVSEVDFARDRSQKIVFTPLHGAAGALMNAVFYKSGFKNFLPVPQQYEPHPGFPTVKAPNPENKDSLVMALEKAEEDKADLILATDGDGDRIGIAYRNSAGKFETLTGNQIGTVLLYYLLCKLREQKKLRPNLFALCSVVSTPLTRTICEKFGITFHETLTGFKNMGNKAHEIQLKDPDARMVLAYEEAFGVTIGDSRDKDGIISNLLAAHIAAEEGGFEYWLNAMYTECGYAAEDAVEKEFPGAAGIDAMTNLIEQIRKAPPKEFLGYPVFSARDFKVLKEMRDGKEIPISHVPAQNLLYFANANGDWVAIRPSGTEPKVKAYLGVREQSAFSAKTVAHAHTRLTELKMFAASHLGG